MTQRTARLKDITKHPSGADAVALATSAIVERCRPLQVVLFGSRARGTARSDSDVDLLVVLPVIADRDRAWREARAAVQGAPLSTDVIVTTPDEIRRRGNLVGPVLRPALRDGVVVYDASVGMLDPGSTSIDGRPKPLKGGPVTDVERLAETHRRLRQVHRDVRLANAVSAGEFVEPSGACYHSQQAAEKALKAILVFLQVEFPRTHQLEQLRPLIPDTWSAVRELPGFVELSEWAYKARYPGDWPEPTERDGVAAVQQANAVWAAVLEELHSHGLDVSAYR